MKNLTLSGSSTFSTNLWHQLKGLFWLKDLTLWLPPGSLQNLKYITAIEAACTKLSQQDAEELRADINRVLRSSHPPKPNLTKAQNSALRELKRDRDRIVLTADKGVAMVVMDRQDYINKANHLLNQNIYKVITKDPTNTIKNKTHQHP